MQRPSKDLLAPLTDRQLLLNHPAISRATVSSKFKTNAQQTSWIRSIYAAAPIAAFSFFCRGAHQSIGSIVILYVIISFDTHFQFSHSIADSY